MRAKSKYQRAKRRRLKTQQLEVKTGRLGNPKCKVQNAVLVEAAKAAARRAYAPYSKFRVGAAVRTKSGKVFAGCNVENASYGLTICAERAAIFAAVAAGEREFEQIVIFTPTQSFTGPCGACRQVVAEFAPELEVVLVNEQGRTRSYSLRKLLPVLFEL
jgi:cytidine deaminase